MPHLDIRSDYSFLKAYGSAEQIINRVKSIGHDTFGLADICSTWGHIPISKAAKKAGLKTLLGVTIPVVPELIKDVRHDMVTLIAKDNEGLREQYELLSAATKQFYYRPRLLWSQLYASTNNVVVINRVAYQNTTQDFLARQDVFLGVGPALTPLLGQARTRPERGVAVVGPVYPSPDYAEVYQLMVSIGTARKTFAVDDPGIWIFRDRELISKYFEIGVSKEELEPWLANTHAIAAMCNAAIPEAKNIHPNVNITLEEWCEKGAQERGVDLLQEPYKSRLQYELSLIHSKGFDDYFLLIADLIQWAKDRMFVGPARGSSAGSLVCWLMGIVEVNPLDYGLMFERFIDVTRTDLPDVDIDFPDERRDEVYAYLAGKYGVERVARLGTVSVFKSKSGLNDVGKSYGIPSWEVNKLSEVLIERSGGDARANMTIEDTIKQFDRAKELVLKYPKIMMAQYLEGHARHTGKHAAGVVIADDPIHKYASVDHYKDGIAELTKYDAESIGLMKIDALGLKTLSVIQDCCDMAGVNPRFLYTYPIDDQEAFKIFQADRVAGIFQFEGYAVRSLMRQMGVENFNDITALTSLARPGPLHSGSANEYIARRIGQKDWNFLHPSLASHTGHSYGTIVYQEQVMSITRDLGDMDWQDVNSLRRAMSKSLGEEFFNKYKDKFLIGTRKKGIDDKMATTIWEDMCTFGSWAFNLSHAVSYALLSYWCAVLKYKYPLQFAVAHLRRAGKDDQVLRFLRELDKEGYTIIPFDPERSEENWSTDGTAIFGGFTAVKGIGTITARKCLEARRDNPGGWIDELGAGIRAKILAPSNTKWHNLKRFQTTYSDLYDNPQQYRHPRLPFGIKSNVSLIEHITEKAGDYCFLGQLKVRNLRDLNETQSLVKRGGQVIEHNNLFLNMQFEDDTGSILCTIDRWKYPRFEKLLMQEEADGHDFIIRGQIRQDGWRKISIDNIIRLTDPEEKENDINDPVTS